jgi:hypothetical protein
MKVLMALTSHDQIGSGLTNALRPISFLEEQTLLGNSFLTNGLVAGAICSDLIHSYD